MENVRVNRKALLAIISANRDKHRAAFEEALAGYRVEAIEFLDQVLADAKAGRRFARSLAMPEPQDHTLDYDRVMTMLSMSVDEVVELTESQCENYVMDRWHWSGEFIATNTRYHGKAGKVHI